jgi:hypothetical protein
LNVSQRGNCFWNVCQEIDSAAATTTAAFSVARTHCVTIQNNHRHVHGLAKGHNYLLKVLKLKRFFRF